jgi:hypothetical protein
VGKTANCLGEHAPGTGFAFENSPSDSRIHLHSIALRASSYAEHGGGQVFHFERAESMRHFLAIAALFAVLGVVGCNDTPADRKANSVRDASQNAADRTRDAHNEAADQMRDKTGKDITGSSVDSATERKADLVEKEGERKADTIEKQGERAADNIEDREKP